MYILSARWWVYDCVRVGILGPPCVWNILYRRRSVCLCRECLRVCGLVVYISLPIVNVCVVFIWDFMQICV